MLQKMLDAVISKDKGVFAKELDSMMEREISSRRYSLGTPKARVLRKGGDMKSPMFWALPYIGVLQSECFEVVSKHLKSYFQRNKRNQTLFRFFFLLADSVEDIFCNHERDEEEKGRASPFSDGV